MAHNAMGRYDYEQCKPAIFTEQGQREFLCVRDHVDKLLREAGAFMMPYAWTPLAGYDSWTAMAYVDRLVELGEILEITSGHVAGQHRVFVRS